MHIFWRYKSILTPENNPIISRSLPQHTKSIALRNRVVKNLDIKPFACLIQPVVVALTGLGELHCLWHLWVICQTQCPVWLILCFNFESF